jgi:curved DNA-binding protein CbpA
MSNDATHYDTLGVDEKASADDIKAAFRQLARKCHPDRNQGDVSAEASFKKVNAAYEIIGDLSNRAAYDQDLLLARTARAVAQRGTSPAAASPHVPVVWRPPAPPPTPPAPPSSGGSGWAWLAGLGLFGLAVAAASGVGTDKRDARTGRYRGPDGRFTSG